MRVDFGSSSSRSQSPSEMNSLSSFFAGVGFAIGRSAGSAGFFMVVVERRGGAAAGVSGTSLIVSSAACARRSSGAISSTRW